MVKKKKKKRKKATSIIFTKVMCMTDYAEKDEFWYIIMNILI